MWHVHKKSVAMLVITRHLFCKFIYRSNSHFCHLDSVTMISVPLNKLYAYEQILMKMNNDSVDTKKFQENSNSFWKKIQWSLPY